MQGIINILIQGIIIEINKNAKATKKVYGLPEDIKNRERLLEALSKRGFLIGDPAGLNGSDIVYEGVMVGVLSLIDLSVCQRRL